MKYGSILQFFHAYSFELEYMICFSFIGTGQFLYFFILL
ncbi:hypothetical protein BTH41_04818 [Bacillus mycoides]|nr:hypothetical protein BTH41_04818 [Bacillus mycoides]